MFLAAGCTIQGILAMPSPDRWRMLCSYWSLLLLREGRKLPCLA